MLTRLIHKPFILRYLLGHGASKSNITNLLRSPNKQVQTLICTLLVALAKSLRENDTTKKHEEWCKTDLISSLAQLLAHEGATRVPATKATTELIRYSDSVARTFVQANGIAPLCDMLLSGCHSEELTMNILLAVQCLFEIQNQEIAGSATGVLHAIGTNFARAMLGRTLLADKD